MNKRGQIYLIASLIIGLIIFILVTRSNLVNITPTDNDFKFLSQNYNQESTQFLSSIIAKDKTKTDYISKQFSTFSSLFTQYSKSQNPTFGLIYFLNFDGNLYIGNFLDKEVRLNDENWQNEEVIPGCSQNIDVRISFDKFSIENNIPAGEFTNCYKILIAPNDKFNLKIGDEEIDYDITIRPGQPEVVVISRESTFQDRKVFVENQFIKGKKREKTETIDNKGKKDE